MQERRSWSSEEKTRALLSPCLPHYYSVQSHINSVTFFTSSHLPFVLEIDQPTPAIFCI